MALNRTPNATLVCTFHFGGRQKLSQYWSGELPLARAVRAEKLVTHSRTAQTLHKVRTVTSFSWEMSALVLTIT
jgi:hypothetical protein